MRAPALVRAVRYDGHMSNLLSVAEALQLIQIKAAPLLAQPIALAEARGLTLAEDVSSDIDSPPHDKAMMDGYAVRSVDRDQPRQVIEQVFAGDVPRLALSAGAATRIMTGAPMPAGADAVAPVEQTEVQGEVIRLTGPTPPAGKHVMPRGQAITAGQVVLRAGASIRSAEVALLSEVGCSQPIVFPRPTVAVLATGAELVPASVRPEPGQIRNSNGPMLRAAVVESGATPIDLGVATDDLSDLRSAISKGREAHVLLVSGGVSAGDRDLTPGVLAELGVQQVFHKVAVKPGKPLWFGLWPMAEGQGPTYVFGLPGNPVSSFVCFQLFVRPLLASLSGRGFRGLTAINAQLVEELSHRGGRETYLPATVEPASGQQHQPQVKPVSWKGSADLAGLVGANALLRLSAEPQHLQPGESVPVLLLNPGGE